MEGVGAFAVEFLGMPMDDSRVKWERKSYGTLEHIFYSGILIFFCECLHFIVDLERNIKRFCYERMC